MTRDEFAETVLRALAERSYLNLMERAVVLHNDAMGVLVLTGDYLTPDQLRNLYLLRTKLDEFVKEVFGQANDEIPTDEKLKEYEGSDSHEAEED